jgi:hypothetical protein
MPLRFESYLDRYSAAARAASRWQEIQRNVADDFARKQELEALIASERQNILELEAIYEQGPVPISVAQEAMRQFNAKDIAQLELRAALSRLPKIKKDEITLALEEGYINNAEVVATQLINEGLSPKASSELLATLKRGGMPRTKLDEIAAKAKAGPGVSIGKADTGVRAAEESRQRAIALEMLAMSSPEAAVGGLEAGAAMEERLALLPEGASQTFATAQEALESYTGLLADGAATVEEFAEARGITDPEQAQQEYLFAKRVYAQAKAEGSYARKDRKFFEDRWLEQAASLAQSERELESLRARVGDDPEREALRREAKARGIDLDDPYWQYRNTPLHGYLKGADRLYDEVGGDVQPATRDQKITADLIRQMDAAGIDWDVRELKKRLRKVMDDDQLNDAVSFALAYDRAEQVKAEGERPTQQELQDIEAARKSDAEALAKVAEQDVERRKIELEDEARRLHAQTQEMEVLGERGRKLYMRLRAAGKDPAEARAEVDRQYPLLRTGYDAPPKDEIVFKTGGLTMTPEEVAAEEEAAPAPAPDDGLGEGQFRDPTDPDSPVYTQTAFGYSYIDDGGREVKIRLNSIPGRALSAAQKGDIESVKRIQQRAAALKPATPAPAPRPAAPAVDMAAKRAEIEARTDLPAEAKAQALELLERGRVPAPVAPTPAPTALSHDDLIRKYGTGAR